MAAAWVACSCGVRQFQRHERQHIDAGGGIGQNLTQTGGLGEGLPVCERALGVEGQRLPLFNGFAERWSGCNDAREVREVCAEIGIGLFMDDDGDVVLPHGELPHARRSHDEPIKSSWHPIGEFFGRLAG